MAKKKQEQVGSHTSNQKQQHEQKSLGAERSYRISKIAHTKLKISIFFDGIIEKVSTPLVHHSLLIINILFVLLLAFSILFYQHGELVDDVDGTDPSTIEDGEEKSDILTPEMLESAVKSATLVDANEKPVEFPFKKVNEWGEIKPTDDKWWNKAFFDTYVFLLDEMKISMQSNTRKVLDSLHQDLKGYFKVCPDSNISRLLKNFFREYLLLRSYDDEIGNPSEIIKKLGGNEYDVVFLVLAMLSKIGVSTEISQITLDEKSALIINIADTDIDIGFNQLQIQGERRKLKVIEFFESFIRFHISKTVGLPKLIKLYELVENLNQSVEIYRKLCKLYLEWEKITEDPALKKEYRDKSTFYRSKLPNDNAEDLFLLALSRYQDGNIQESWQRFNELVDNFPNYTSASGDSQYYYLALMGNNKYEAGAIEARKLNGFLTHLDYGIEKHRKVLTDSAYLFYNGKQYNISLIILNNLEKRGFADVRLYLTRSEINKVLKNYMPSISNLRAAIEMDDKNRKLRAQLIQMLLSNKLYMEAYNECDMSADSPAKMIYALKIGVAIAEEYLNDLSLAVKMLTKYVQLNPKDDEARKKLESMR